MRGNHIVWGRVVEPIPDRISDSDKARIAECELRDYEGRLYQREVWLRGVKLGIVRVRADGQWHKPEGGSEWIMSGWVWGDTDPQWGLAILDLLNRDETISPIATKE